MAGQAPSIAQELVKDWVDDAGNRHPGLIDENHPDMVRWGETFPHAVKEHCLLLEPRAYRNKFFEAVKDEVSSGHIKFPPPAPKYDVLVLEETDANGKPKERKLGKDELNSLIQMDLMKEEAVSIVRTKTSAGNITYGLPPEKKNKMHDDRIFVMAMFCWWIKQLQVDDTLVERGAVDYEGKYLSRGNEGWGDQRKPESPRVDASWSRFLKGSGGRPNKAPSPFKGKSPFK